MARNRQFVWDFLAANPCVDCGADNPAFLQFDHIDPSQKFKSISDMLSRSMPLARIIEEIAKCEVRCANCHALKTARDGRWYKNIDTGPWKIF